MERIILKARDFATLAHAGQRRKYTGEPYIIHPEHVAGLVQTVGAGRAAVAAAYLHDTVEDTDITVPDIRREFGDEVAALVREVTDVSRPEDGNRATRKAIDRAHLAESSPRGATIKLADMIDNTSTILRFDPAFAKVYMKEKKELLKVLGHGDPRLLLHAVMLVNRYFGINGENE